MGMAQPTHTVTDKAENLSTEVEDNSCLQPTEYWTSGGTQTLSETKIKMKPSNGCDLSTAMN